MKIKPTGKHKRGHSGAKSSQKSIEWKRADQNTINKLGYAGNHDVEQIGIDNLQLARRTLLVIIVKLCERVDHFNHDDL